MPGSALGRLRWFDRGLANGRNRRIFLVAAHPGDRLLSEPTAGTQPCRREPLFMPHSRPSTAAQGRSAWGGEPTFSAMLEKGVSYPGLEIIAKLANALGVEPAVLLMRPEKTAKGTR